ncbi:MAG TPA: 2-dehydropantoate 2-reductase N-terminal domain-containing protein [Methanocella sp.]|nr:2-dehydropantoate 2-reductase N-terminal domain-containing protein [Methanocella sp.]
MKILVVGTGVIGTIYGWALAESGNEVVHYVRKGKKDACNGGIKVQMLDERKGRPKHGKFTYYPACAEDVPEDVELVIVPVGSHQLEAVLLELSPKLGKAQFLIMSSNWQGTDHIDRILSRDRYLLGYADGGGTYREGMLLANLGPNVHLGELDGQNSQRLQGLIDLFRKADMTPEVAANILHWLWVHNATSVAIWAGFQQYREMKPFLKDGALVKDSFQATKECLDICRKRGVDVDHIGEISYFKYPVWLLALIFKLIFTFNKSMQIYTAHAASEASMKEMKGNFLAIYHSGKSLDMSLPYMDKLYVLMEKG